MAGFHGNELRKGRFSQRGQIYLITSVTAGRNEFFSDWRIGRLLAHELKASDENGFTESLAWVIMPDHLHWLFRLENPDLSKTIQRVKFKSALRINHYLCRRDPVWQRGFHDRALRQEEDLLSAARYVVANPLRSGLVDTIEKYPLWDAIWVGPE